MFAIIFTPAVAVVGLSKKSARKPGMEGSLAH